MNLRGPDKRYRWYYPASRFVRDVISTQASLGASLAETYNYMSRKRDRQGGTLNLRAAYQQLNLPPPAIMNTPMDIDGTPIRPTRLSYDTASFTKRSTPKRPLGETELMKHREGAKLSDKVRIPIKSYFFKPQRAAAIYDILNPKFRWSMIADPYTLGPGFDGRQGIFGVTRNGGNTGTNTSGLDWKFTLFDKTQMLSIYRRARKQAYQNIMAYVVGEGNTINIDADQFQNVIVPHATLTMEFVNVYKFPCKLTIFQLLCKESQDGNSGVSPIDCWYQDWENHKPFPANSTNWTDQYNYETSGEIAPRLPWDRPGNLPSKNSPLLWSYFQLTRKTAYTLEPGQTITHTSNFKDINLPLHNIVSSVVNSDRDGWVTGALPVGGTVVAQVPTNTTTADPAQEWIGGLTTNFMIIVQGCPTYDGTDGATGDGSMAAGNFKLFMRTSLDMIVQSPITQRSSAEILTHWNQNGNESSHPFWKYNVASSAQAIAAAAQNLPAEQLGGANA